MPTTAAPYVPLAAHKAYLPVKLLGSGKDSTVLLALKRKGLVPARNVKEGAIALPPTTDFRAELVALKIASGENAGQTPPEKLKALQLMQADPANGGHLVRVLDFDPLDNAWHVMEGVSGASVESLLSDEDVHRALPPALIFHIFVEVYKAQQFLIKHGECHADLSAGGNVMITAPTEMIGLPHVRLVDFGGLMPASGWRKTIGRQLIGLIWTSMGENVLLNGRWEVGGKHKDADNFFRWIADWDDSDEASNGGVVVKDLDVIWEMWGTIAERLRIELRDEATEARLLAELQGVMMGEEEIRRCVERNGMDVTVHEWEGTDEFETTSEWAGADVEEDTDTTPLNGDDWSNTVNHHLSSPDNTRNISIGVGLSVGMILLGLGAYWFHTAKTGKHTPCDGCLLMCSNFCSCAPKDDEGTGQQSQNFAMGGQGFGGQSTQGRGSQNGKSRSSGGGQTGPWNKGSSGQRSSREGGTNWKSSNRQSSNRQFSNTQASNS
ncbi:hypothetical protein CC80DRAFT_544230 [Byssothecium circinans]|uniref:Protein kinase domain-containing protein n=1 Tax=Byssothecium circinans TaxID=147558 RepID=A0A6A5U831_9PLEO|nr:hypothetical protein CC80DRAFT_544230 [Byssothecium circinans]